MATMDHGHHHRDHLQHCVAHAFHGGDERERQTKIDELLEVLDNRRR